MNPRLTLFFVALVACSAALSGAEIVGTRVNNMACDNFYFNAIGGSKTVRLDKFAVYAYHEEKTKYYVYTHPGDFAGTESDASKWTLVSTTEVKPTGHDNAFELSAGGTFIEAGGTRAFLITADLANDNGALWGGADGELKNDDVTITTGRWLTRFLSVSREGGSLKLSWSDPTFHLVSSAAMPDKSWTPVPGTSPVLVAPREAQLFYLYQTMEGSAHHAAARPVEIGSENTEQPRHCLDAGTHHSSRTVISNPQPRCSHGRAWSRVDRACAN